MIMSLVVFVPVTITHGWAWGRADSQFPTSEEPIEDLAELPRLLRSYGRAVSRVIKTRDGDRFNVTAFGGHTGKAYGRDQWQWDSEIRLFRPHGDPWVPLLGRARLLTVQARPASLQPVPAPVERVSRFQHVA
jgi:hypothetical protein